MTPEPPRIERYTAHWTLTGCLLLGAVAVYLGRVPVMPQTPPGISDVLRGQPADWFLMVRIPEVPREPWMAKLAQERFESWLAALAEHGFTPALLSEVQRRLAEGSGLPEKTVVMVFDPGYRGTYETLAPVLEKYQYPTVWLTDRAALRRGGRRYLSHHAVRVMKKSKLWEVGFYQRRSATFTLESYRATRAPRAHRTLSWHPDCGRMALNRGVGLRALNRLNVNLFWTPQELVNRLLAEAPIRGTAYLTAREIQGRTWGMAVEVSSGNEAPRFRLCTRPDARSATISWPSTLGPKNLQLELRLASLVGELWVFLCSDRQTGQNLRVGFRADAVVVEQDSQGQQRQLASFSWPEPRIDGFAATLHLGGRRLRVSVNGKALPELVVPEATESERAMVEIMVYDQVRGAACAESVSLVFTSLPDDLMRTASRSNGDQPWMPTSSVP